MIAGLVFDGVLVAESPQAVFPGPVVLGENNAAVSCVPGTSGTWQGWMSYTVTFSSCLAAPNMNGGGELLPGHVSQAGLP